MAAIVLDRWVRGATTQGDPGIGYMPRLFLQLPTRGHEGIFARIADATDNFDGGRIDAMTELFHCQQISPFFKGGEGYDVHPIRAEETGEFVLPEGVWRTTPSGDLIEQPRGSPQGRFLLRPWGAGVEADGMLGQ